MARRKATEPIIQSKQFASIEEIDRAIDKLCRRIDEVKALNPQRVRWDSQDVKNVEDNIHKTILAIFGERSPEYRDNGCHAIGKGGLNIGDEDCHRQQKFADGIPDTVAMLEGLIRGLEEEKQGFVPPKPGAPEPQPTHRQGPTKINIQGGVERLAIGDINEQHVTVVAVLNAVADAVEKSPDIPPDEKVTILERLRALAGNPCIASLGSGAILELLSAAFSAR